MTNINSGINSIEQTTELYVKKVLAGNIKTVRLQVINSMESLGYDIIEEEPNILGRRGAKGWGTWYGSADVLDYPMNLTVRLKSLSETSTRVTFDYLIKHAWLNKGEKSIVVQEAKTIAETSKTHAVEKMCSVCETESTDDSKFCRRCGAPLTNEQAELEVLRMMAETRAAKTSVVGAAIAAPIAVILMAVILILSLLKMLDPEALIGLLSISGGLVIIAMFSSFFGWNRLKRALEKPEIQTHHIPTRQIPESIETGEFEELPPHQPVASITEGTTNLLSEEWIEKPDREKVPVHRKRDTNNFN